LPKDIKSIQHLVLPLRDWLNFHIRRNEREFGYLISQFKDLCQFDLLVGDGVEDEPWSKDTNIPTNIQNDIRSNWVRINPNKELPQIKVVVISEQVAKNLKITDLMWC
jgi:hypothetical protein